MVELFLFSSVTALAIVLSITWDKYRRGCHRLLVEYTFFHYLWDKRRKALVQFISIKGVLVMVMVGLYYLISGTIIFSAPIALGEVL